MDRSLVGGISKHFVQESITPICLPQMARGLLPCGHSAEPSDCGKDYFFTVTTEKIEKHRRLSTDTAGFLEKNQRHSGCGVGLDTLGFL